MRLLGKFRQLRLTDGEIQRACLARALEWQSWPLFLAQPIVPFLYCAHLSWSLVWPGVVLSTLIWERIAARHPSLTLARLGSVIYRLGRWPSTIGVTILFFKESEWFLAVLTLLTIPISTVLGFLIPANRARFESIHSAFVREVSGSAGSRAL